jgi:hypothetical protein
MKNCQLREQAALLRLQLERDGSGSGADRGGDRGDRSGRSGPSNGASAAAKEAVGLLAELSARLAAVEEQAEALSKQLDESTDTAAVATAAHLERKLNGLRRALDALEPGSGSGGAKLPSAD